jgi:transcriptional regulator with GAF, ATPase, and Fis domain
MEQVEYLKYYFKNPGRFSILILGERGIGKTKWVKQIANEKLHIKLVVANCASFSDDTMAESELFGHAKGAFTGAISEKNGLFKEANNGILFLDEVHNLSARVQEKVMTALQTESSGENKGKFCIRRLGENEATYVAVRPVFASNLKLSELKKKILPDLYDRISQLVVEFPSIRESKLDVFKEFNLVWEEMQFNNHKECPCIKNFKDWLKRISLEGNYRTLQSIAINWHQGRLMYGSEKEEEVFEFVKSHNEKYHTSNAIVQPNANYNFRKGVSMKTMEKEYELAMLKWAFSEDGYGEKQKDVQKGLETTTRVKNPNIQ